MSYITALTLAVVTLASVPERSPTHEIDTKPYLDYIAEVYRLSAGSPEGNAALAPPLPTRLFEQGTRSVTLLVDPDRGYQITIDSSIGRIVEFSTPRPERRSDLGGSILPKQNLLAIAERLAERTQIDGVGVRASLDSIDSSNGVAIVSLVREFAGVRVGYATYRGDLDALSGLPIFWMDLEPLAFKPSPRSNVAQVAPTELCGARATAVALAEFNQAGMWTMGPPELIWRLVTDKPNDEKRRTALSTELRTESQGERWVLTYRSLFGVWNAQRSGAYTVDIDAMTGEPFMIWFEALDWGEMLSAEALDNRRSPSLGPQDILIGESLHPIEVESVERGEYEPKEPNAAIIGPDGTLSPVQLDGSAAIGFGFRANLKSDNLLPKPTAMRKL